MSFFKHQLLSFPKRSKLLSNTLSLLSIQIVNYILPLLTIPYLIKILGPSQYGIIALSQVLILYAIVFVDYGFNLSATRLLSINRENTDYVNRLFSTVSAIKILLCCISLIGLGAIVLLLQPFSSNSVFYLLSFGLLLGQTIQPTWFYMGIEEMKMITVSNAIFKAVSTLLLFVFVRDASDLNYVAILNSLGALLAGAFAFFWTLSKYKIIIKLPSYAEIKGQMKEGADIFYSNAFANILSNGGLLCLGLLQSSIVVGYYSAIEKIIKAGLSLFQSLSQALYPNFSYKYSQDKKAAIKGLAKLAKGVLFVILLGLIALPFLSKELLTVLFDPSYGAYAYIFNLLGVWAFFSILNNFIGIQFLVGTGNGKTYRISFFIAGFLTMIGFTSIKYFSIDGLVFSMLFGEIALTVTMVILAYRKRIFEE